MTLPTLPKAAFNHVFMWVVALLHLHIMVYRHSGTVKAGKLSGCPFVKASTFFGRHTAFITNSLLFRNPSAIFKLSSKSDVNTLFRSSNIAQYAMNSNSLSEILMAESKEVAAAKASTSEILSSGLKAFMPTTHFETEARKQNKQRKLVNEALEVVVIGLSHHNAKVDVREKLAIPEAQWNLASTELCEYDSIMEASVLSTCNRFEIYLSGTNPYEAIRDAVDYLYKRSGGAVDHATLKKHLFMLSGEDAIWHLLRVSSGLDSLIIGEGQILAQVKRAYEHGVAGDSLVELNATRNGFDGVLFPEIQKEVKVVGGRGGKVITNMFKSAVTTGKRVRTETAISKGKVSVSSVAAEFSALKMPKDCDIHDMKHANIAIVGAGKMTKLLLHNLEYKGVTEVTVVNRGMESIETLQADFPKIKIVPKLMDDLYSVIAASDIVYSATSAVLPIINPDPLAECLSSRDRPGGLQLIDISVPRNIHPNCSAVSKVACYNVDDLNAVVSRNTARRRKEMIEAEHIMREEMNKFKQWHHSLGALPTIEKLQKKAETMRLAELTKVSKKLSALDPKDFKTVEGVTRGIVSNLLSGPMRHLRKQNNGEATRTAIHQVQQAFQLE